MHPTARASRKGFHDSPANMPNTPYAQLKAFKAGERGADKEGKDANGKIMSTIAARMTDAQMKAIAEYTSGLR
jgi:cytochrome c553